jgi:Family of unknown function (DUF6962)
VNISEPVTLVTDYLLAVECLIFGVLLFWKAKNERPILFWSISFFTIALAAATGGTYHGFVQSLSVPVSSTLWKITLYSIGVSTFCMLSGMILAALKGKVRTVLLILAAIQFLGFVILIGRSYEYKYVIHDYVPAMAVIVALCILRLNKPYAIWIIAGILISFAAAGIQLSGFTLHRNFNHNDLYHVVQMIAMYLLYKGGSLLGNNTVKRNE